MPNDVQDRRWRAEISPENYTENLAQHNEKFRELACNRAVYFSV